MGRVKVLQKFSRRILFGTKKTRLIYLVPILSDTGKNFEFSAQSILVCLNKSSSSLCSISQVPMSWAGRRFGRIRVITLGMVLASLIMIVTPFIMNSISTSESAKAVMFTSRLLIGLLQGGCYPLLVGLWGKWAPKSELSRLISVQFAGSGEAILRLFLTAMDALYI